MEKARLVSFSDASLANLKNGGSQDGGINIFVVGENGEYTYVTFMELQENQTNGKKYHCNRNACLVRKLENCFLLGSVIKEMLDVNYSPSVFQFDN